MRSRELNAALSAFVEEAAGWLADERALGAELPFDVVQTGSARRGGTPLYCYRPMTGEFILERMDGLSALASYVPALQALAALEGIGRYLRARGQPRVPTDRRACAETALRLFLSEVFEEATEFDLDDARIERVYALLESAVFAGASHTLLLGVVRGLAIVSPEISLGMGLVLARAEEIDDVPPEAGLLAGDGADSATLVLRSVQSEPGEAGAVPDARVSLRELVAALRLFGDASPALEPLGWMRVDEGPWRPVAVGREGPSHGLLSIDPPQEDELRAFCSFVSRRSPRAGELAWALRRFHLGCERDQPMEMLTDHLLALRALLEPEGPQSSRLPGRVAALCAVPEDRAALAARVGEAVALERAVMAAAIPGAREESESSSELAGHLRALLRDVICGHLDSDLRALADQLILEEAGPQAPPADQDPGGEDAVTETRPALGLRAGVAPADPSEAQSAWEFDVEDLLEAPTA